MVVFGGGSSDTSVVRVLRSLVSESNADISGVFLEDQTLFRAAELPFITELSRLTTARRPLAARELERQLRVQAKRAERELRILAESLGVPWSFRTHRGPLSTAIAEASGGFDLLLLGAARQALVGEFTLTARAGRQARPELDRPIGALIEQADTGRRALEAAIDLARSTGRPLLLFLSDSAQADDDLRARLQVLGPKRAVIHTVPDSERGALLAAIRRTSPAMLVAFAGGRGLQEHQIAMLRRELRCPVVVVRGESD
jgi:hypothetical protein